MKKSKRKMPTKVKVVAAAAAVQVRDLKLNVKSVSGTQPKNHK